MSARTHAPSEPVQIERVASTEDVQKLVQSAGRVLPVGAGTKPTQSVAPGGTYCLDMRGLRGIVEYEPAEYTITAWAGTPLADVDAALRQNGQYLPFDPVFMQAGSTVGGAVASGLSGPGRLRYGGIRDFILGTHFVDGQGRLLRGGGKVVKNAAGFDFPKLLVGSMGRLGVVIDATFKVFPRPATYATLLVEYGAIDTALSDMQLLSASPIELITMDLLHRPASDAYTLALRIGGSADLLDARVNRLAALVANPSALKGEEEAQFWKQAVEFTWARDKPALAKVPLTPAAILTVERALAEIDAERRYSVAGNVLWLAWPAAVDRLGKMLSELDLGGVVLRGSVSHPLVGSPTDSAFAQRIKSALDPHDTFPLIHPH